jgi:hypothetical protein
MQLEHAFGGPDDEPIEGKLDRTAGKAFAGLGRHVNRINGALTRIPGHTNFHVSPLLHHGHMPMDTTPSTLRYSLCMKPPVISKSRYMAGLQCPRLLWHYFNRPDIFPPIDAATQAIFDQGVQVGALAKQLFPKGIEIGAGMIKRDAVNKLSCAAVSRRLPMFEAGFLAGCAYARADVLVPVGREQWDIVEVKSTTKTKAEHVNDLALQRHVYEGVGLGIRRCFVMHLNSAYVRRGEIDPSELFTKTDVTADVDDVVGDVGSELKKMVRIIGQQRSPDADIGLQCSDPYDCPLQPMCWKAVPKHSVLTLAHVAKKKAFQWFHDGHARLQDLPRDTPVNAKQQIQLRAIRSRRAQVDRDALREFLDGLEYPLHFLDFETINPAIPVWNITSPYQQVPFQFSLHIVSSPGGKPAHHGFLAEGTADPRPEILALLKRHLGQRGSIIAYSASFEKNVLRACGEVYPAFASWWARAESRVVDLLQPFRSFHYYHPDQCGSASLKAVLPALTGKGYADMKIADGATASQGFLRITFGEASAAEHRKVRAALEKYCALDTEGMVWIVKALDRLR